MKDIKGVKDSELIEVRSLYGQKIAEVLQMDELIIQAVRSETIEIMEELQNFVLSQFKEAGHGNECLV